MLILKSFGNNVLSIREISTKTGIDWYTVERQLTVMKGRELVEEVFTHRMLRLFRITELGKKVMKKLSKTNRSIFTIMRGLS